MTTGLVPGSGAAAKWFVEEDESEEMRESEIYTRSTYRRRSHHICFFALFVELSNVLRYISGLTPADAINAVEALKALHLKVVSDLEV